MNKFKVTKIGLLNFWLYDEEEFDFYGGNLILRGTNGSGKSVTMQSFIPLILDGNKSPDRLDPFGSKERKIEDYIIGDNDSIQKEESTAYLYMETYLESENKYLTIGLGFRGRKNRPVESWGFALKDGRRIRKDFFLYKDAANKIPLNKNELKGRLGTENEYCETMKDYKKMVNRLLFGFPTIETYDEFIKLLLQLRSNKLSKDYKPTNLVNVLNTVLQPLSEEDLRPLSEAIEEMNKTKEKIETLENHSKSLKDLLKVYKNYNEAILFSKTREYKKIKVLFENNAKEVKNLKNTLQEKETYLEEKERRFEIITENLVSLKEQKRNLDNQDLKKKVEELTDLKENLSLLVEQIQDLEKSLEEQKEKELKHKSNLKDIEDKIYCTTKEINNLIAELKNNATDAYFNELHYFLDDFSKDINSNLSFDSITMSLNQYLTKINTVLLLLEEEQITLQISESKRIEYEKLENNYHQKEIDLSNQENNLKDSILSWQEDFINKNNNNQYLQLNEEIRKEIFQKMNEYTPENFTKAKEIFSNYAKELKNNIEKNILKLESKKQDALNDKNILLEEYNFLKNQDDIELDSLNIKTDKCLDELNIPNIPFYKCIEFKENIPDSIKNNIESSLLNLNILNAKIIKEEDINKVKSLNKQIIFITKSSKKKNNITKYFNINIKNDSPFTKEYINEILESISIDVNDTFAITEDGITQIEGLKSIADKEYTQNYIGYLKRIELKNKKLKEYESKIEKVTKELENITSLINSNNEKIEIINLEESGFPNNELITKILDKIKEITYDLEYLNKKEKELEQDLLESDNQLKEIKEKITIEKQDLQIPLNLENYQKTKQLVMEIKSLLQDLKEKYHNYKNNSELKKVYEENLNDSQNTLEYLEEDLTDKEKRRKKSQSLIKSIEELLNTKEYLEQKEKIIQIENDLLKYEKEKEELIALKERTKSDLEHLQENLQKSTENLLHTQNNLDIYTEIFLREYKLNYVYNEEIADIDATIDMILKDSNNKKELKNAFDNFYIAYNKYRLELNDYSLKDVILFNDYEGDDEEKRNLYEINTRRDIKALYHGSSINIIELSAKIDEEILENKDLINEQDRHLFEDILLNTVGDKIRKRIKSSKEWVEKINEIMKKMQENSALSFKLVWKNIVAEKEDEMDTKELVRLLNITPEMIKPSDLEKLTNHFRSKIKKAESYYTDSYISFYKIIEEVLDYRNWFTFQLLYQRKGMDFKELTDKVFAKFSGGERAKSMYIPLFASCYAKLNLAAGYALRLIALDEAFAGVDEDNIREMFGILKYLDINFIINSQVLWGDYDTVEKLSICELIRPLNSQTVTVERYKWNGMYKEIITNREELDKDETHA